MGKWANETPLRLKPLAFLTVLKHPCPISGAKKSKTSGIHALFAIWYEFPMIEKEFLKTFENPLTPRD